jgi:hypothetical protein
VPQIATVGLVGGFWEDGIGVCPSSGAASPECADAPDFIISLPLSNIAAPEDGRTPPRPSPAVTDPLRTRLWADSCACIRTLARNGRDFALSLRWRAEGDSRGKAAPKPTESREQATGLGTALVCSSYSHRILIVFSSYSHRILIVFSSYSHRILIVFSSYSLGVLLVFYRCPPRDAISRE